MRKMTVWLQWKDYMVDRRTIKYYHITGKSFSEVHILASTNPQYDKSLFIESPVQCMKIPSWEHVVYTNCLFLFWYSEQFMYTACSDVEIFMFWTGDSMNKLLSYCGLVVVLKA